MQTSGLPQATASAPPQPQSHVQQAYGQPGAYPGYGQYQPMPGYGAPAPGAPQPGMPGPDGQKRAHLYVGQLSPRVTEYMLQEIFAVAGPVMAVKIIPDRTYAHGGLNYGFVEYHEMRAAETALQTLNGRKIFDTEIRVNWAYQNQAAKEDLTHHFHVFVGDLSPDVNDEVLGKAFAAFGSLSDARVMWDMNSGKSRGYGFLAFRDKTDAEQAIATMNGEWLGSRAIRVNWANQKNQGMMGSNAVPGPGPGPGGPGGPGPMRSPSAGGGGGGGYGSTPVSYEAVVAQSPPNATTVYVGNLVPYATQADLIPLFQGFGYIVEIRMQADRGFAFVKLDSHENAAMAIVNLQGTPVHGRALRCSWGKDRSGGDTSAPIPPPAAGYGMQQPHYAGYQYPQQGYQYPQQAYQGYYGQPGQAPGAVPGQDASAQSGGAAAGAAPGAAAGGVTPGQWNGYPGAQQGTPYGGYGQPSQANGNGAGDASAGYGSSQGA